jgi:nucleoside 2-deoxyribosyltransferase
MSAIYLAGPINGCTDDEANGWRQGFIERLAGKGFVFLDPMVRDYRGREDECVAEIVEGDKGDIDACDTFLAYCWQTSWGTGMEILYAWETGKHVLLVIPEGVRISPWQRYHSHQICWTLAEAAAVLGSTEVPGA